MPNLKNTKVVFYCNSCGTTKEVSIFDLIYSGIPECNFLICDFYLEEMWVFQDDLKVDKISSIGLNDTVLIQGVKYKIKSIDPECGITFIEVGK